MTTGAQTTPSQRAQSSDESAVSARALMTFVNLAALELSLLWAAMTGALVIWMVLVLHVALIAVAVMTLMGQPASQRTSSQIGLLAALFSGPLGALGALCLTLQFYCIRGGGYGVDLAGWYHRHSSPDGRDQAAMLHDEIRDGRSMRRDVTDLPNLVGVLESGDLPSKQAMLGFIGLNYHPDYRDVLLRALASPDAIVRVQAAAVFAKLRESFKARMRHCERRQLSSETIETGLDQPATAQVMALIEELRDCVQSGFLDPSEQERAKKNISACCGLLLASEPTENETELLVLRILGEIGDHKQVSAHLARRPRTIDGGFGRLYINALMQSGNIQELAAIVRHQGRERPQQIKELQQTPLYQLAPTDRQTLVSLDGKT